MAQLVAHPLDVREVTSSSLVSSTIDSSLKSDESFIFANFLPLKVHNLEQYPSSTLIHSKMNIQKSHKWDSELMVSSILAAEFFFMVWLACA